MLPFYCDICREHIGSFDPDTIKLPLSSDQFGPKAQNYEKPYLQGPDYLNMRCPMCRRRPFEQANRIRYKPGLSDDVWFYVKEQIVLEPMDIEDTDVTVVTEEDPEPELSYTTVTPLETKTVDKNVCPDCGKRFKKPGGVGQHRRFCKERNLRLSRQAKESQNGNESNPAERNDSGTDKGINIP